MLPKRSRRQDADTLTWEYLDGEISPSRAERLSKMLIEKAAARQRFVEAATMHGMLFDYFKNAQAHDDEQAQAQQAQSEEQPRRSKRRRWSAA